MLLDFMRRDVGISCRVPRGESMGFKLLTLITAVGLGVIGLVIWVWFASYLGGEPSGTCASDSSRNCVRMTRDGSAWLVQQDGHVVRLSVGRN